MALSNASVLLIASFPDGRNVTEEEFAVPLRAAAGERFVRVECDRGEWRSAKVEFMKRSADDYRDAKEPSEAFASDIANTLTVVAGWLDERRAELERLRTSGLELVLLFDLYIDQDQLDLSLPPGLLRAAGAAGIPIQVITND